MGWGVCGLWMLLMEQMCQGSEQSTQTRQRHSHHFCKAGCCMMPALEYSVAIYALTMYLTSVCHAVLGSPAIMQPSVAAGVGWLRGGRAKETIWRWTLAHSGVRLWAVQKTF